MSVSPCVAKPASGALGEFIDPPTKETLEDARRSLASTRTSVESLATKIDEAEAALAQLVRESRCAIDEMRAARAELESRAERALAYLSPLRRLPLELLREIFLWAFEDHPCAAWVLSAVCTSWRRLALRIPVIWSKIRLLTTQHSSADTIRLWLERSGDTVPLDIEIFLRIAKPKASIEPSSSRPRRTPPPLAPIASAWNVVSHPAPPHYIIANPPPSAPAGNLTIIMPPSPAGNQDGWAPHTSSHDRPANVVSRVSMHWGHIAFFYLVEQMHRWERFVFRFDKQFTSMGALKSINGDAPLLREFEVSSVEAAFFAEWPWLPNASAGSPVVLPNLQTLTLQHTPFKWSSPMLRNLHTLNLRALPTSHLPLDRILHILSNNIALQSVALHFQGVLPAVLPLQPLALPSVTSISLGGHFLLTHLLDALTLPALESLTLDIEARDPLEDVISALLTRSNRPPVRSLAIAYAASGLNSSAGAATFYYGPGGIIITWSALLAELPLLRTLAIGGAALEPLLTALGPPEDDPGQSQGIITGGGGGGGGSTAVTWACPTLEMLGLRGCHAHNEGVTKLVQMIDSRNPDGGSGSSGQAVGGVTPVRLRRLELHDCTSLGEDVMRWLESRVTEVICSEPAVDRSPLVHPYL